MSHELQDRYARLSWNFTALDVVLSGIYRTDVPRRHPEARERKLALATMGELGVALLAPRRFLELSRGEQRRVLIARGVAFAPSVLLLDEPASGLDRAARIELGGLLERVPERVALVCAAHVEADLPSAIDRIVRLEHGRIVASGARSEVDVPAMRDTRGTTRAAGAAAKPMPTRARGAERAPTAVGGRSRRTASVPRSSSSRTRASGSARGACSAISTGESTPNQQWLVTGANGSGKSTLLRMLHGQLRPAQGRRDPLARRLGYPRSVWTLRRQVAWVSPELQAAYRYPTTVRELRRVGLRFELRSHARAHRARERSASTSCSRSSRSTRSRRGRSRRSPTAKRAAR